MHTGNFFGFEIIIVICMIILNAIFASYEMALATIFKSRLVVLKNQKKKGADASLFMKDKMEASLAVIQLAITLVGAIAATTGGAGISETLKPYFIATMGFSELLAEVISLIIFVVPLSCAIIIFGELVPKTFALNNREWVCLKLSPVMKVLSIIAYPIVRVFEIIVKKIVGFSSKKIIDQSQNEEKTVIYELKAAASLARSLRLIGLSQEKIVLSAADLSSRTISGIMLPSSEISMIPIHLNLSDALIKAQLDMHTRFPVCEIENEPQTIKGYINFKDIVSALKVNPEDCSIKGITRPIKKVRDEALISDVLAQMINEKAHIAIVITEEDRVAGLVTLEDIVEEFVGEIEDEFDRLPNHFHQFGSSWIVGGGVPIDIIESKLNIVLKKSSLEGKYVSLAEWVFKKLGRIPNRGEIVQIESLQITVRKLRRKKIYECVIDVINK